MKENDFYKNIKVKKTSLIVGIVIFVFCLGLGLILYYSEKNVEYENFTKSISDGVYAKLNVQMLESSFAIETDENSNKKEYYLAYDENENPFIVVLDNENMEKLRSIQEYTLSVTEMAKPEAITIYGHTSKIDTEVFKYLQEYLMDEDGNTYGIDDLKNTVGNVYLDTYWKASEQSLSVLIVFGLFSLIGVGLIIYYLISKNKYKKMLKDYGDVLEEVSDEISSGKVIYNKVCGVYITSKYLISYLNGLKIIDLNKIVWVYPFELKQNGISTSKSIYIITNNGKTNVVGMTSSFGKNNKTAYQELYQDIKNALPNILYGYNEENKKMAKELYIK